MNYEYQSIFLSPEDEELTKEHSEKLNEYFNNGWEYVQSICQTVASSSTYRGATIVILRKEKITDPLN